MSEPPSRRSTGIVALTVIYWVLAIVPLIVVAAAFPSMPETAAIHFDLRMQPDGWGPRWQLFLLPTCVVGYAVLMWFIVKIGAENTAHPQRTLFWSLIALLASLVIFNILTVKAILASNAAGSI